MGKIKLFRHFFKEKMIQENSHPYGNGTVSNIKSRPMIASDINIKEVYNLSEANSIDHVAYGATENQCKTCGQERMCLGCIFIEIKNDAYSQ